MPGRGRFVETDFYRLALLGTPLGTRRDVLLMLLSDHARDVTLHEGVDDHGIELAAGGGANALKRDAVRHLGSVRSVRGHGRVGSRHRDESDVSLYFQA